MNSPPALRLRRDRQPPLVGNVLALAVFGGLAATILAGGLMPGPTDTPATPSRRSTVAEEHAMTEDFWARALRKERRTADAQNDDDVPELGDDETDDTTG